MKKLIHNSQIFTFLILGFSLLIIACEGDFRSGAIGSPSEVLVVIDSTNFESKTALAIMDVFGRNIPTMPRPEPMFDVVFSGLRVQADVNRVQKHKNLIIAATLEEDSNVGLYLRSLLSEEIKNRVRSGQSFSFPLRDRWYRDQYILILTANTDEELSQKIKNNSSNLTRGIYDQELARWDYDVYRRGDQPAKSDSLWKRHGWRIRVQHDYHFGIDTTNFVSMRRYLQDNDRWIWVHWLDDVQNIEQINSSWINQMRDSLLQEHIKGSRDSTFIRTDYRRPHETKRIMLNGKEAFESKGIWVMSDFSMGGPYINYTIYDEDQKRLYLMEFAQFSPRYRQRRFLYQFEAIARTFDTDPLFLTETPDPSVKDNLGGK